MCCVIQLKSHYIKEQWGLHLYLTYPDCWLVCVTQAQSKANTPHLLVPEGELALSVPQAPVVHPLLHQPFLGRGRRLGPGRLLRFRLLTKIIRSWGWLVSVWEREQCTMPYYIVYFLFWASQMRERSVFLLRYDLKAKYATFYTLISKNPACPRCIYPVKLTS